MRIKCVLDATKAGYYCTQWFRWSHYCRATHFCIKSTKHPLFWMSFRCLYLSWHPQDNIRYLMNNRLSGPGGWILMRSLWNIASIRSSTSSVRLLLIGTWFRRPWLRSTPMKVRPFRLSNTRMQILSWRGIGMVSTLGHSLREEEASLISYATYGGEVLDKLSEHITMKNKPHWLTWWLCFHHSRRERLSFKSKRLMPITMTMWRTTIILLFT